MAGRTKTIGILAIVVIAVASTAISTAAALRYRAAAQLAEAQRDVLISQAASADTLNVAQLRERYREVVAQLVRRNAGVRENTAIDSQIRAIRDLVYRDNKVGSSTGTISPGQIFTRLGEPGYEQLCGGMSEAYAWALKRVGVPARVVQLASQRYLDGEDRFDTHVTVEAFVDGKWRVSDPTFNTEFQCSGSDEFLDIEGLKQCNATGGEIIPVKGASQIVGRTLEDYYAPFSEFLAAYKKYPIRSKVISSEAISFPTDDWDVSSLKYYGG